MATPLRLPLGIFPGNRKKDLGSGAPMTRRMLPRGSRPAPAIAAK